MFDRILGNYLVKRGRITSEQLEDVIATQASVRVKLGLIAVAEKLMTKAQADEVNQLQSVQDKRFGDIAVERGYLTDEQVGALLKKQGNAYMVFVQTLTDKEIMGLEEVEQSLAAYQKDNGFTKSDMDDLMSGDVDRIVKLFLPETDELTEKLCGIVVRTMIRLIDSGVYVSKARMADSLQTARFAMQALDGEHKIVTGFAGMGMSLLKIANAFAGEEFDSVDLDALDAVGEFINCVNGLFATDMCGEGVDVDMLPPAYYDSAVMLRGEQFVVFPMHIGDEDFDLVLAVDHQLNVK